MTYKRKMTLDALRQKVSKSVVKNDSFPYVSTIRSRCKGGLHPSRIGQCFSGEIDFVTANCLSVLSICSIYHSSGYYSAGIIISSADEVRQRFEFALELAKKDIIQINRMFDLQYDLYGHLCKLSKTIKGDILIAIREEDRLINYKKKQETLNRQS